MLRIVRHLTIRGTTEAYMIRDEEMDYPVFAESLHCKQIFDELISSGYKFCGLPFDFQLDGVSIQSLPAESYIPTSDEEQDMFDIDSSAHMTTEELLQRVSKDDVRYLDEPETNYIYTTREEFLKYLDHLQTMDFEEIPLPINYFVHPSARFTMSEWLSGEYAEYFMVMEKRRAMTYQKYRKLRDWLCQVNPKADSNYADFVDAYYMWGIDGLNVKFIHRKRKTYMTDITANYSANATDYLNTYRDFGLVDMYGATYPPEDITTTGWKVFYGGGKEDIAFRRLVSNLKEGEYGIVPMYTQTEEEVVELQSMNDSFMVTPYRIICGTRDMLNFRITTFDVSPVVINARWWGKIHDQRVYEMSWLRAISYSILELRKRVADVSSFKALQEVGLDVSSALNYIIDRKANVSDEITADGTPQGVDPTIPTAEDIENFLQDTVDVVSLDENGVARMDFIRDVIAGKINIDGVADGAIYDESIDVKSIYRYLYCLHFCRPHVSMERLAGLSNHLDTQIVKYTDNTGATSDVLKVEAGDGFIVNIPCPLINAKVEGYKSDLLRYKVLMAEQCACFCKVVEVAREYGVPEAQRHVAVEIQSVKIVSGTRYTQANANLQRIINTFTNIIQTLPESRRRTIMPYVRTTCMREYFRIAEYGYMLVDTGSGQRRVDFDESFVDSVNSTIEYDITSTAVYSKRLYFGGRFSHFCVNADITPFYVYPLSQVELPEVHIRALWDDLHALGAPHIYDKLVSGGFLYEDFVPWTYRYSLSKHFKDISFVGARGDLTSYIAYCKKFSASTKCTEEFVHAPHMETLIYDYYPAEDVRVDNGVILREEGKLPPVVLSAARIITKNDYPDRYNITETIPGSTQATISRFYGFTDDDFEMLTDVLSVEVPESEKYIIVEDNGITTDVSDSLPFYMVEQLVGRGYPIVNMWGRIYLLRDAYGILWKVVA